MSKAPDSASPPLIQDTHLPVIWFCVVGQDLKDTLSLKKPNIRLSSLSAAPGFSMHFMSPALCVSAVLDNTDTEISEKYLLAEGLDCLRYLEQVHPSPSEFAS